MELREALDRVLEGFPQKERYVIIRRLGLDGDGVHTLAEIGRELGVSRERARQIERTMLERLRKPKYAARLREFL